jgi:radial spoke head protein 3
MCCQTDLQDLFLHRPVTAVHVPSKIGVDASTEILDGELFDFDAEVQPILNNLIGKTLQQALEEVVQEEEIADLREQQQRILAMHEKELAELKRLEQADHSEFKERSNSMQERITAAKLLQGHIAELLPNVLESIESLRDADNKEDLQKKLTPWLAEEVATEIGQMIDSRELLLEIV